MSASLQARLSVWIVKWRVKRKLKGVRDYRIARKILRPDPYEVPSTVQISPAHLSGVPGERLEGPSASESVLFYLHGGGYFACSPETHRPITVYFAPWPDLAATGDSIRTNNDRCAMFDGAGVAFSARYYLGDDTDPRNPLASPLYADLSGLPPLLIHVGADEVLLDDSTRLAERARAAGVHADLKIWPVVPHAWQLVPHLVPESRQSLRESADFLREQIAASPSKKEVVTSA